MIPTSRNILMSLIIILTGHSVNALEPSVVLTEARSKTSFNKDWKFSLGDHPDYRKADFDDSGWRNLDLPHDWSIEGEFCPDHPSGRQNGYFPEGLGWYRKTFSPGEDLSYKQVVIQFDGVYMNSEVWVNDKFLGRYPYGYSTFQYDMTEYLDFGEEAKNVIAVRVDNSLPVSTRWYNGSGIYRNVHLITTNYTHFTNYDGVYITTPVAEKDRALVRVDYRVIGNFYSEEEIQSYFKRRHNREQVPHPCILRSIVFDPEGNEVARVEKDTVLFNLDKNIAYAQQLEIAAPRRWSAETPHLYTLKSEIEYDGGIMDDQVTRFGIRKLEYIPHKGMFVNGKSVELMGVCLHHDGGSVGAAVPDRIWQYRLQKLKDMGCNAIRTAHNPFAPEFYDICDELGLYVQDEAFDEWTRGWPYNFAENYRGKADNGYHLYFDQWAETDLRAMIQRDRNHPCVVMYSIGNEVPTQLNPDGYKLARKLVGICHEEDATRPATAGCDQYMTGRHNGFMDELDIAGYNYVERHLADSMYLAAYVQWPEKLSVGTETGRSLNNFLSYRDHDFAIGQFIWIGWDYLGETRQPPQRGWQRGLFDISGNPSPDGLRHEAYWSDKPVAHIAVSNKKDARERSSWNWSKGDSAYINVYSNCEEVELSLNGKSLGRKKVNPDTYMAEWDMIWKKGELQVTGYNKKKKAAGNSLTSTGDPEAILAKAVWKEMKAGCGDISIIEVALVDKAGNVVPEAVDNIRVTVEGNARLIGIDSGNLFYEGSFKADIRDATRGRIIAIIQAEDNPGQAAVKITSGKLKPAEVLLSIN